MIPHDMIYDTGPRIQDSKNNVLLSRCLLWFSYNSIANSIHLNMSTTSSFPPVHICLPPDACQDVSPSDKLRKLSSQESLVPMQVVAESRSATQLAAGSLLAVSLQRLAHPVTTYQS